MINRFYEINAEGYAIECAINNREAANALKQLSLEDMLTPAGAESLAAIKPLDGVNPETVNERLNYKHFDCFTSNTKGIRYPNGSGKTLPFMRRNLL